MVLCIISLSGCVSPSADRSLQMPETFLGAWGYWKGHLSLTINPDGNMLFANRKTGELTRKVQYKILHVYDKKHVVMVHKNKFLVPVEKEWSPPSLLVLSVKQKQIRSSPTYHWSYSCLNVTEDIWDNPLSYKDLLGDKDDVIKDMCAIIPIWSHSSIVPVHPQ